MPTSEERREVAARLREYIVYAKAHDKNGDCTMGSDKCVDTRCTLYNDIASCIEECGNFNLSAEQVFTRLADLMDPTCSMEYGGHVPDSVKDALGVYFCSECGSPIIWTRRATSSTGLTATARRPRGGAMAREIRAPEQVTDAMDAGRLLMHANSIAEIVARNTRHSEGHVLECVMRVVGHLCATGGDAG